MVHRRSITRRCKHAGESSLVSEGICLTLTLLLYTTAAAAQTPFDQRSTSPRWSAGLRVNLNTYIGERPLPEAEPSASGAGLAIDLTRQLTDVLDAGLFYSAARFSDLHAVAHEGSTFSNGYSRWIHTIGAAVRFTPRFRYLIRPYATAAAVAAYGMSDSHVLAGFGPRLGIGASSRVGGQIVAFVEADVLFVVPGNSLDRAGEASDFDALTFLGAGLRYRFAMGAPAAPEIRALYGAAEAEVGEVVVYGADVRHNPNTKIRWDFADGATSDRLVTEHTYTTPGSYVVSFTLGDDPQSRRILTTVVNAPSVHPEIAQIAAFPDAPSQARPARFSADLKGSSPLRCRWDFGDGATSEDCDASHTYNLPGPQTISLRVENEAGFTSMSREIVVRENPCANTAALHPVYFESNLSTLDVNAREFLRENVARIFACPAGEIQIHGYAAPGEEHPLEISRERAAAVGRYYGNLGVPAARMLLRGNGNVGETPSHTARWQYRYVESVLSSAGLMQSASEPGTDAVRSAASGKLGDTAKDTPRE